MLLGIALPMIVSNAAETLMMFVDRMFLSRLGREHLAAAMTGGLTLFVMMTFFLGLIGYVNALVAQYLGAGRKSRCAVAAAQGLILGLASYPLILLVLPLGRVLLSHSDHDPLQHELELVYFSILGWGSVMALLRCALSGFFCGLGRTRVVMVANVLAMLVNVAANYVLIFGRLGFPALGIRGAAYGTLLGSGAGLVLMLAAYLWPSIRREFDTLGGMRLAPDVLRTLFRFGFPSGVEFFLNLAAFNAFVQMFHSYGRDAAAAITITFNWDFVAFFPLMGFSMAVTSLVGRYMGAGRPDMAARSAFSGLKAANLYAGAMSLLFFFCPGPLVSVFARGPSAHEYEQVIPLAVMTLRLAGLYTLADAALTVFAGALRGAGDTRWTMKVSVVLHWMMAVAGYIMIRVLDAPPVLSWLVFCLMVLVLAFVLGLRFVGGRWRDIQVIRPSPVPAVATAEGPPDAA